MNTRAALLCLDPVERLPFVGYPVTYISWGGDLPGGGYAFFFCGKCRVLFDDEGNKVTGFPLGGVPAFFLEGSGVRG